MPARSAMRGCRWPMLTVMGVSSEVCGTCSPLPNGLADSHIALRGHEGGAAFGGLELEPALEHDDGSGLAVVAGPSAEAGADPSRIGERAPGVGVALSFGPAFEALAQGFDEGQVVRAEGVGDGPEAALSGGAVAGVAELLDGAA